MLLQISEECSARQAFLLLRPSAGRIVLLDHEEVVIDARFLLDGDLMKVSLLLKKRHRVP